MPTTAFDRAGRRRLLAWTAGGLAGAAALLKPRSADAASLRGYPRASLPTRHQAGKLARVTDGVRGIWMDQGTQWFGLNGEVANPREFGARADGVTDDTAALQAAIDAIPMSGGTVLLPPGVYRTANLQIVDKTNFTLAGNGATLQLVGPPVSGNVGLQLVGTLTNLTIRDLVIVGDGTVAGQCAGVWSFSGQTLSNIKVLDCRITDVVVGVSLNADAGGSITGAVVRGNHIENVVGTAAGTGYGIHHANGSGQGSNLIIQGNTVVGAQRHGIYQGKGSAVTIQGNTIRRHRTGVADGSLRCALVVSRSEGVTVSGNVIDSFADGGMEISPTPGNPCRGVVVDGNVFSNPQTPTSSIWIGSQDPVSEGTPEEITIANNVFLINGMPIEAVHVASAKRLDVSGNSFLGGTYGVVLDGRGETAGTATYTDDVRIAGNVMQGAASAVRLAADLCGSSVAVTVADNLGHLTGTTFDCGAAVEDPNVRAYGQCTDGLTFAPGVGLQATSLGPVHVGLPAVAPVDADIAPGSTALWVDATANELRFRVRYADGTLREGTVALT